MLLYGMLGYAEERVHVFVATLFEMGIGLIGK